MTKRSYNNKIRKMSEDIAHFIREFGKQAAIDAVDVRDHRDNFELPKDVVTAALSRLIRGYKGTQLREPNRIDAVTQTIPASVLANTPKSRYTYHYIAENPDGTVIRGRTIAQATRATYYKVWRIRNDGHRTLIRHAVDGSGQPHAQP